MRLAAVFSLGYALSSIVTAGCHDPTAPKTDDRTPSAAHVESSGPSVPSAMAARPSAAPSDSTDNGFATEMKGKTTTLDHGMACFVRGGVTIALLDHSPATCKCSDVNAAKGIAFDVPIGPDGDYFATHGAAFTVRYGGYDAGGGALKLHQVDPHVGAALSGTLSLTYAEGLDGAKHEGKGRFDAVVCAPDHGDFVAPAPPAKDALEGPMTVSRGGKPFAVGTAIWSEGSRDSGLFLINAANVTCEAFYSQVPLSLNVDGLAYTSGKRSSGGPAHQGVQLGTLARNDGKGASSKLAAMVWFDVGPLNQTAPRTVDVRVGAVTTPDESDQVEIVGKVHAIYCKR